MKQAVFADTGFWIALFDSRDANHPVAKNSCQDLLKNCRIYMSDFVVFETITYLNCSVKRHDLAIRFLDRLEKSSLKILTVDEPVKSQSLDLFKRYSDKALSMTDCTGFVLMTQHRIRQYAGFDDHFRQMGFNSFLK